ncbi:MAG: hypothetical protein FJY77_05200 [Candidatus Altiarchaeales archaeon]|nr:hypothetical protein [Candidatus Altiarchaeales archaeon]
MTKHVFKAGKLMGVVVLGECKGENIEDGLKGFRPKFEKVHKFEGKSLFCDHVTHGGIPVGITVSYEGEPTKPRRILVSALDLTGRITMEQLKADLDEAVRGMGLKELQSEYGDFKDEPFGGWKHVAIREGLVK